MSLIDVYRKEMEKCNNINDKEKRLECKIDLIRGITKLQDYANLNTIRDLDDENDSRWVPLHMIDELNAIILGILEHDAKSEYIRNDNYIKNHKSYFEDMYIQITGDYR